MYIRLLAKIQETGKKERSKAGNYGQWLDVTFLSRDGGWKAFDWDTNLLLTQVMVDKTWAH